MSALALPREARVPRSRARTRRVREARRCASTCRRPAKRRSAVRRDGQRARTLASGTRAARARTRSTGDGRGDGDRALANGIVLRTVPAGCSCGRSACRCSESGGRRPQQHRRSPGGAGPVVHYAGRFPNTVLQLNDGPNGFRSPFREPWPARHFGEWRRFWLSSQAVAPHPSSPVTECIDVPRSPVPNRSWFRSPRGSPPPRSRTPTPARERGHGFNDGSRRREAKLSQHGPRRVRASSPGTSGAPRIADIHTRVDAFSRPIQRRRAGLRSAGQSPPWSRNHLPLDGVLGRVCDAVIPSGGRTAGTNHRAGSDNRGGIPSGRR